MRSTTKNCSSLNLEPFLCLALAAALAACGGELVTNDGGAAEGGSPSNGGTTNNGGGTNEGGSGAEGGAGGGTTDGGGGGGTEGCDDPDTCEYDLETTCMGEPANDPTNLPACPAELCPGGGLGRCIPTTLVPKDSVALLADCSETQKCVPDSAIMRDGLFTAPTCEFGPGYEGRCLSTCIPDVASQIDLLPQDICAPDERCAPCTDPFTGEDTGACTLSCDQGPTLPPKTFPACCEDLGGGKCVPADVVGEESAATLDPEECEGLGETGSVCVPDVITDAHLQGQPFVATSCTTNLLVQLGGGSAQGGCLPRCIPEVNDTAGLAQDGCPDQTYRCVPCTNGGASTGACEPQ
ncbi:MAG: hypothetical protein HOW73_31005 [Polyangiaceae bacterium]|nr:hypothetical protein [Polyangiaceae bacterium]